MFTLVLLISLLSSYFKGYNAGHLLIVGNSVWETHSSGDKPEECAIDTATQGSTTNSYGNDIGVQCCKSDGTAYRYNIPGGDSTNNGCRQAVDYQTALDACVTNGDTLCTATQVRANVGAGTGCSHDARHVWTSTACAILTPVPEAYWTTYEEKENRFGQTVRDIELPSVCRTGQTGCDVPDDQNYVVQPWYDDLKYAENGKGGWTDPAPLLRFQSSNEDGPDVDPWNVRPFEYPDDSGTNYYYYHGDFSGAEGYAQGTINSFYRYFTCPFEATLHVKWRTRFCGSETEDKVFVEINGVQLGYPITLGCDGSVTDPGSRPGTYSKDDDLSIDNTCKGGGYAAWSNCARGQYREVGELAFEAETIQWFDQEQPIQVQFFWRYSYQDDNIWIYNIELTCKPTPRGLTGLHASIPESIKWEPTVEWDQSANNWETTYDSCGELIVNLLPGAFSSDDYRSGGSGNQYQPVQAKKTGTAWCGISDAVNQTSTNYLQVKFNSIQDIGYVRTWGRPSSLEWTTSYKLEYTTVESPNDDDFTHYGVLTGNHNANSAVSHRVQASGSNAITARYLRFIPIEAHGWPCLRVDAFYPPQIPLIASLEPGSFTTNNGNRDAPVGEYQPDQAKITGTSWCGASATVDSTNTNYLEINLGASKNIKYIHTFGRATSSDWVTQFKIHYKVGDDYLPVTTCYLSGTEYCMGNLAATTANVIELTTTITTTHIRFTPIGANTWPCMRVEAYETDGTTALIGGLTSTDFSANPSGVNGYRTSDTYQPFQIKSTGTSWCGPTQTPNDASTDYIQIDLGEEKDMLWIYAWGGGVSSTSADSWVTSYQFRWSNSPTGDFQPIVTIAGQQIIIPHYATYTNYDATSVVAWELDEMQTARYIRIIPKGSNGYACMRIEVYPPFSDPLCLDDDSPKFFNNGYMISLEGRFRWKNPSLINLMGGKDGGKIGYISEEHARPKFNEEFTTITQDGTSINIEIQNDGYIYLREWTTPFAHFDATGSSGIYYTFNTNPLIDPVPNQRPSGAVTTIRECSLDGIVYVSEHAWGAADPAFESQIIVNNVTPITPINTWYNSWFNVLVTFAICILFILYCQRKSTADYSKVVNYEDTETESVVVHI